MEKLELLGEIKEIFNKYIDQINDEVNKVVINNIFSKKPKMGIMVSPGDCERVISSTLEIPGTGEEIKYHLKLSFTSSEENKDVEDAVDELSAITTIKKGRFPALH